MEPTVIVAIVFGATGTVVSILALLKKYKILQSFHRTG